MSLMAVDERTLLDDLQRRALEYFLKEVDGHTGLVRDRTHPDAPASIAGSGFALTSYVVGAMRGFLSRKDALGLTRLTLRFLAHAPQGDGVDPTGYRGLFYHFLDMRTGRRAWRCELSTIDTAICMAGVLAALNYFDGEDPAEREVRSLADGLYRRVEWDWLINECHLVSMGWRPKRGFLRCAWQGYSEGLLLYVLGLGSPSHPLTSECYPAWADSYTWARIYGYDHLYAGPLFIHQLPQLWLDLRGIRDAFMLLAQIDYFENSRRATYVQQEYARRNPRGWTGYSTSCWGITASDGPGPLTRPYHGEPRTFMGYHSRGVPYGPDDGTFSPWAVVGSLPFAPEIVMASIRAVDAQFPEAKHGYGYTSSLNPSVPARPGEPSLASGGWVSPWHYAINQGLVLLMIENYRTEAVWRLMRRCPYIVTGLLRAGFRGGWLSA